MTLKSLVPGLPVAPVPSVKVTDSPCGRLTALPVMPPAPKDAPDDRVPFTPDAMVLWATVPLDSLNFQRSTGC